MVTEDDVRRAALALPGTVERSSYGTPGFRVRDRLFARILEDGDLLAVWVEAEEEKLALLEAEPATYTSTPHYDGSPIVLVRLDAVDADELREVLESSWCVRGGR